MHEAFWMRSVRSAYVSNCALDKASVGSSKLRASENTKISVSDSTERSLWKPEIARQEFGNWSRYGDSVLGFSVSRDQSLIESSVAVTFSSKLIHRFSDEAKSLRVSRNGELFGSWPKHSSVDYYQLLVSSDLQRQKMKLGGQHGLIFPSEGSKTMSFGNDFGWLHYTWIDIGTPNVSFLVALDAGSDLLWVPCDCIQCAPLSSSYYSSLASLDLKLLLCSHDLIVENIKNSLWVGHPTKMSTIFSSHNLWLCCSRIVTVDYFSTYLKSVEVRSSNYHGSIPGSHERCSLVFGASIMQDRDLNAYSPSGSRTSKHLSCSHQLCELGQNCKSPKQPCPYIVNYYSANTSTSGLLVEDTLHLASESDHASKSLVQARVILGCGRIQSGGYLDGVAPDGLMGLGLADISVPSLLAKAGLVRNSFSLCFNEDDSGRIFFGDQGRATQQSTPFLPSNGKYLTYMVGVEACCIEGSCLKQTGFQAQVDSGTSFTFLPAEVYKQIVMEFDRRVNATRLSNKGYPWEYCYESSFVVYNPAFRFYGDQGITGFCLAVQPTDADFGTIGQNFITGYRMVFNRENLKLGWSRSNCQDLSDDERVPLTPPPHDRTPSTLPTNEQQRSPSGHAVAPAVAGRAPYKPSSASRLLPSSRFCLELRKQINQGL